MFRTRDGKFAKKAASFNNLIPFKSSTEPLDKDDCIVEGRRIVELSEIVHQLQEGCRKCGTELRLREIKCERRVGLASLLTIECEACRTPNTIRTPKAHQTDSKQVFDVNTKAALGK